MRSVAVFVKGPGAGRESALRALQTVGLQGDAHPRRHADPAQRLPPAQAAPRLIYSVQCPVLEHRSGTKRPSRPCKPVLEEERETMARYHGPLQALPPRGDEALPQGRALLLREVRLHAPALPAGPARPGAHQAQRVRDAPAREAEGAAHLRRARAAVPASTTSTPRRRKGRTGEQMLGLLESRLDNVVHRLGFAAPRSQARQLVRHGHVLVNGKRVDIPSYVVRPGDKIEVHREEPRDQGGRRRRLAQVDKRPQLSWLELDKANFTGIVQGRARCAKR